MVSDERARRSKILKPGKGTKCSRCWLGQPTAGFKIPRGYLQVLAFKAQISLARSQSVNTSIKKGL